MSIYEPKQSQIKRLTINIQRKEYVFPFVLILWLNHV